MSHDASLELFLPPVRAWFQESLGEPTPAQKQGWPSIKAGNNTLILAPTGSGKTLAAFLACLDGLWQQAELPPGVKILYISPLKALNNDIERNLRAPLRGVLEFAQKMHFPLRPLTAAVRTGDTTQSERQRQIRRPPDILITTPESLHLLLTSRGRAMLGGVTHCIVDEIHALSTNKRGVFLSLLLERLQALRAQGFVRIGLSATQRPLDEVARFLGGCTFAADGTMQFRPVNLIDAGLRKDLDLQVVSPVEQFGPLPERSIWPSIYRYLEEQVRQHRSTLIFTNNRRSAERITAHLNANEELARAHHGSVSLEVRQQIEAALKEGRLPAVVATASLELGIDMGAIDLVCQVESPGSVARALQRVGRAGHVVGQKSKGRLLPKTSSDLLEQAVLAREMAAGRVEEIQVPRNCLDVLAQQIIAAVAVEDWDVSALYALVRRSYPFRDLTPQGFESVLEMVSGRFRQMGRDGPATPLAAVQARISWDRTQHRLRALPGSRHMALVGGGTIPDTGQYAAYTNTGVRIGELDEEFIYERRIGDTFLLGTNAWRLDNISNDRVTVVPAEGAPAIVPFWRGERAGRSYDLGVAIGRFLSELSGRLNDEDCSEWLQGDFFLNQAAARNLRWHVRRQLESAGHLPTDTTVLIETFRDPLGDWQVVILSPFGQRLHLALRLALEARLRQRLGYRPQCLHHDDGVLIRLTDMEEPVLDLLDGITSENVQQLILEELGDSALFAIRFRHNASRALLLPRLTPGKRAPLWLQRLRSRDLLQVARKSPDFPLIAETVRECFHDHLDLPRLEKLLGDFQSGKVKLITRRAESPSPFASGLLFAFTMGFMYVYDRTDAPQSQPLALDPQFLEQLADPQKQDHLLDPRAMRQVDRRLRGVGRPSRTATEMAERLRMLGDLKASEMEGPMAAFVAELEADERVVWMELPVEKEPRRCLLREEAEVYRRAFGAEDCEPEKQQEAAERILLRFLETHALVSLQDVLERYPFRPDWARQKLEQWAHGGRLVVVQRAGDVPLRWSAPENLAQVRRGSLALLRDEVHTCPPEQFADFQVRWQYAHPHTRCGGREGLEEVLLRLEGLAFLPESWEQTILPARVLQYQSSWLDDASAGGAWTWVGQAESGSETARVAFWSRASLDCLRMPALVENELLSDAAREVLDRLRTRGAQFLTDLASETGLTPSQVRTALWQLLRRSLVTNDRFEVVRRGEKAGAVAEELHAVTPSRRPMLSSLRRRLASKPEGRWAIVPWGHAEVEEQALHQASLLLQRYGIVARELALMDTSLLPWRVLYEVYSRLELAGEVRRGYIVEGLSGAQFALPEAIHQLQEFVGPSTAHEPCVLLHSQDPANLYGAGAPFDVPLLDGGTRSFSRRPGNWIVLRAGRPLLLIEQQGRTVTALASASAAEIAEAVRSLPEILDRDRGLKSRHKLTVETWNQLPVTTSPGKPLLEQAGFVRDYQGLTLYAAWR